MTILIILVKKQIRDDYWIWTSSSLGLVIVAIAVV